MSTPTHEDLERQERRAWNQVNDTGRLVAGLLSQGYTEAAQIAAAEYALHRDWWREALQQQQDLQRIAP